MSDFSVTKISVKRLHRHLEDGPFAVPHLQREFVWNGHKAAKLLDSIYRGMPIGAILVWRTAKRNQHYLRNHLHILPPFDPRTNNEIWFLIEVSKGSPSYTKRIVARRSRIRGEAQWIFLGWFST